MREAAHATRCHKKRVTMPKLTCGCLNVKIYAKKVENKIVNVAQLGIGKDVTEEFFSLNIAEAQLDLEGIRTEQPALLKQRTVKGWRVHQCVNCEMLTHAMHGEDGSIKVLINLSLKSDPTIIESLESSPDFSPLYKLVLKCGTNDNQNRTNVVGLQSEKYELTQRTLTSIQEQLNKFIESEKNAMEERIRLFEEQQQAAFAELQSKVRREKNAMLGLVLAAQAGGSGGDNLPTLDNPIRPLSNNTNTADGDYVDGIPRPNYHGLPNTAGRKPATIKTSSHRDAFSSKRDDDDLFDLDDINEDDQRPFYNSDDENEDTDDSSITEDVPFSSRYSGRTSRNIYSSSVPISVPNNWRPHNMHPSLDEEDDDRVPAPDMEDMAASIKALARSVHTGDGTEVFGDLPRRRFNTMEMGKL